VGQRDATASENLASFSRRCANSFPKRSAMEKLLAHIFRRRSRRVHGSGLKVRAAPAIGDGEDGREIVAHAYRSGRCRDIDEPSHVTDSGSGSNFSARTRERGESGDEDMCKQFHGRAFREGVCANGRLKLARFSEAVRLVAHTRPSPVGEVRIASRLRHHGRAQAANKLAMIPPLRPKRSMSRQAHELFL